MDDKMDNKLNVEAIQEEVREELVETESEEMASEVEEQVEKVEKPKKPLSKNAEAKEVMHKAEKLIVAADNEVNEVKSIVAEHVSTFAQEKENLTHGVLATISTQLEKMNHQYEPVEIDEPFELTLGTNQENLKVSNVGSGRFSALVLSLIGTVGTAAAWIYFASKKTGTVLDPSMLKPELFETITTNEKLAPMFQWVGGGMTSGEGNTLFGLATIGATSLLAGFAIYKMRVAMKENKNYKVAHKTFNKTEEYVKNQQESKTEIEKVDAHIAEIRPLIEDYRVLLDEQSAKLQRILHIEGELEDDGTYASASQTIMDESERLSQAIEKVIATPVTKEGRVNEASTNALMEAKAVYEAFVAKLYA